MGFPSRNSGVGCHFLLQWIFLIQGSSPSLLHWQVGSLPLSHPGSFLALNPSTKLQLAFESFLALLLSIELITIAQDLFYLCLFIRSFIELSGHLLSPRYVQALGQARGHCGVRFAVGWGTQPEGMRGTVWVLLLWGLSRAGGADEQCSPWGGLGRLPGGKLGPGG